MQAVVLRVVLTLRLAQERVIEKNIGIKKQKILSTLLFSFNSPESEDLMSHKKTTTLTQQIVNLCNI